MTINKNGIINCIPIEGFKKVSFMNTKFIQSFSDIANWQNGHWWGNSSDSNYKRTTVTFKPGTYKIITTDGFIITDYLKSSNGSAIIPIRYDKSTDKGIYANGDTDFVANINSATTFTLNYDFRIYLQTCPSNEILKTVLNNVFLYKVGETNNTINSNQLYEI